MKRAVFPGSFDPVTKGHIDLITRSTKMFDELVIGVLVNIGKVPLFSLEARVEMLKALTKDLPNVTVKSFDGLLADFVEQEQADAIVRGLRNAQDFEYEMALAQANSKLNPKADTVFLATAPEYSYISSSGVKEIYRFGGNIQDMVPELVFDRLQDNNG
ncbi:MAG: pantetheine-phosphate adenylyltransferase [Butyribacter sp.]|nr:pantetheine-phosphate adenylyltransferase [bacterium]MDY3854932.1 pantetheine-phosphate adenylyltransferase [Butyribacter sp.]